jgi:hypothetical protein
MFTRGPMIGRIACVISVLYLLLISPGLRAQSTTDGAIAGTVTDASGAAVPNASVTVTNKGTNLSQGVATDESGYFRAAKLQPGSYRGCGEPVARRRRLRIPCQRLAARSHLLIAERASLFARDLWDSDVYNASRFERHDHHLLRAGRRYKRIKRSERN